MLWQSPNACILTALVGTKTVTLSWGLEKVLARPRVLTTVLRLLKLGWLSAATKLG